MAPKKRARLGLLESEDIDDIVIDDSDDGEAANLAAGPSNVNPLAGSQQGSQVRYQSALCQFKQGRRLLLPHTNYLRLTLAGLI